MARKLFTCLSFLTRTPGPPVQLTCRHFLTLKVSLGASTILARLMSLMYNRCDGMLRLHLSSVAAFDCGPMQRISGRVAIYLLRTVRPFWMTLWPWARTVLPVLSVRSVKQLLTTFISTAPQLWRIDMVVTILVGVMSYLSCRFVRENVPDTSLASTLVLQTLVTDVAALEFRRPSLWHILLVRTQVLVRCVTLATRFSTVLLTSEFAGPPGPSNVTSPVRAFISVCNLLRLGKKLPLLCKCSKWILVLTEVGTEQRRRQAGISVIIWLFGLMSVRRISVPVLTVLRAISILVGFRWSQSVVTVACKCRDFLTVLQARRTSSRLLENILWVLMTLSSRVMASDLM